MPPSLVPKTTIQMLHPVNQPSTAIVRYIAADESSVFRKRLDFYGKLPIGWHFGEGRAVTPAANRVALLTAISAKAQGFTVDVFPDLDGGALVSLYGRGVTAELNVLHTGDIQVYFVHDNEEDEEGELFPNPLSAIKYIKEWNPELLWSAWYPRSTTSPKRGPSKTSYLSTAHMVVEFPSSTKNAPSASPAGYAVT